MLDPNRKPEKTSLSANIVIAALLSLFAMPVLLIAGCFPAVLIGAVVPNTSIVIGIVATLAIGLCAGLAYHAGTPGHRIGFIIAAIEVVLFCIYLYFQFS